MPKSGLRVGVVFGGRSVEHDVSIITGLQALEVLSERHDPKPIYIARSGRWYTGDELSRVASYRRDEPVGSEVAFDIHGGALSTAGRERGILSLGRRADTSMKPDVVILATHGTEGEDGCLQGVFEVAGLPYAGPSVSAAAAAMDKVMSKAILTAAGLPVLPHIALRRESWQADRLAAEEAILSRFEMPIFVKPASLGSSIGVSRCESAPELADALQLVFELDRSCLVERAVEGGIEVNCAVLGRAGQQLRVSVCEQPLPEKQFLSFDDKYLSGGKGSEEPSSGELSRREARGDARGGVRGQEPGGGVASAVREAGGTPEAGAKLPGMQAAKRLIPAPIDASLRAEIEQLSREVFEAFGCAGVSRIDFLLDAEGKPYVNECNTIPGSFSFYLWERAGLSFVELMDELIEIAFEEREQKKATTRVFATNLLAERMGAGKA